MQRLYRRKNVEIVIAFTLSFILLLSSVFKGIFVGYPLVASLVIFIIIGIRRGFTLKQLIGMTYEGSKKSFVVLKIFILIGAITAAWMASGTVPAIVYYGLEFLKPNLFILSTFLITSFVSILIGTSFGAIGTVGIALMVMARGGGVNTALTAGAILSGAYFGDRCSPMSSSANLVANLTGTNIYTNIKSMLKTSVLPFAAACLMYLVFSLRFPLGLAGNQINEQILGVYNISLVTLLPAAIIIVFSLFKVNVKSLMFLSVLTAAFIGILIQRVSALTMLKYILAGYKMPFDSPLKYIIKGGGILSMLKISLVVFVSSGFNGIFDGTGILKVVEDAIAKVKGRSNNFMATIIVSIASAAFGCSQALAVILTNMLMKKNYEANSIERESLAVDLENSAIVIAPLIPWNIAVLVPLTTLEAETEAIMFAFYLYFLPLFNYLVLKISSIKTKGTASNF
jgi:Na+:H+ antiporter, NhaC family